jgi:hypothetical protein
MQQYGRDQRDSGHCAVIANRLFVTRTGLSRPSVVALQNGRLFIADAKFTGVPQQVQRTEHGEIAE